MVKLQQWKSKEVDAVTGNGDGLHIRVDGEVQTTVLFQVALHLWLDRMTLNEKQEGNSTIVYFYISKASAASLRLMPVILDAVAGSSELIKNNRQKVQNVAAILSFYGQQVYPKRDLSRR
jgi:hypothetical protein